MRFVRGLVFTVAIACAMALILAAAAPATYVVPGQKQALEAVKTAEDSAKLSFGLRAQLASAAAWSPNPKNPPLYLDLPTKNGQVQPDGHRLMNSRCR